MRIALLIEIEELVFDTLTLRAQALQSALEAEGIGASLAEVQWAHAGVTAQMALARIPVAAALDGVGESLALRRTADAMQTAFDRALPTFVPTVRDRLDALSSEFPVAVVTRATRDAALQMLEQAGLDRCMNAVRSLGDMRFDEQPPVWSDALSRLRADRGVAIAGGAILSAARIAGLHTVLVGGHPVNGVDESLISLDLLDASFIASLF